MNPFKGVSGRRRKRKPKSEMVEVKQEPGIKPEPNDDGGVVDVPRPTVDGRYRANYEGPVGFADDFDQIKDEFKCEEKETDKEKDSTPCENAGNDDDNEQSIGDVIDVQPPQPVLSGKKWNRSSKGRNQRVIPRNQVVKKQKKHKCHVCNHLARCSAELQIHLRIHTGEKPYQCVVCLKYFTRKSHLNGHKKTHGQFRCSKCYKGFEQESAKIDHEALCNPRRFECDICGYKTMKKSHLTVHMPSHTGLFSVFSSECTICFKSFTSNANLRNHSITHKDELPNACSKCGRRFATLEVRQAHETCFKQSVFVCNQCHYKTFNKTFFKRHMQSKHGAKRSIDCGICSKQFVYQIDLNRHLSTTHSGQFPFQCSKCFEGYANEDAKEVHEDSCGYRQFQCHLCNGHCCDKQKLKIHMRKDHTGERIQCEVCAASFADESNANRHMKAVHRFKKN